MTNFRGLCFSLLLLLVPCTSTYAGDWELDLGIGVIDEEFGQQRDNPIGIIKLVYNVTPNWYVEYYHASGMFSQDTDGDYGINIISANRRFIF